MRATAGGGAGVRVVGAEAGFFVGDRGAGAGVGGWGAGGGGGGGRVDGGSRPVPLGLFGVGVYVEPGRGEGVSG